MLSSTVVFHDGWIPYAEQSAWPADANCALSCTRHHLKTRFAFRTRLLDCLGAGLPIVCTTGDDLAARVIGDGLGAIARPGDAEEVAVSLEVVLRRGRIAYADRLAVAPADHTWSRVAQPLLRWVLDGTAPVRLGESREAVAPPLAQRARELAYLAAARPILARIRPR